MTEESTTAQATDSSTLPDMATVGKQVNDRLTALEGVQLSAVATSGRYSDLKDTPTLGALSAKDGITIDDFTGDIDYGSTE